MKYILILIMSLLSMNVYADKCDSQTKSDLLKEANLIKVDYDEKNKIVHVKDEQYDYDSTITSLMISIYNLSNNFNLEISNNLNDDVIYVDKEDFVDGKYTFEDVDYYKIIKYKIEVYSDTSCDRYLIKTITYTKPMYNLNSSYGVCDGNENISYCQKYITNPKLVFSMGIGLEEAINSYKNGDVTPDDNNKVNFFAKYYPYMIAGIVVVGIIGVTIYFINKKRSQI